jgi:hypothetical protein
VIRRLVVALLLIASLAQAQEQPQAQHMQAYRERLALYLSMGQTPQQVVVSMTNYFPWFGARFGVDVDRDGGCHYFVALGHGTGMTFYALLN